MRNQDKDEFQAFLDARYDAIIAIQQNENCTFNQALERYAEKEHKQTTQGEPQAVHKMASHGKPRPRTIAPAPFADLPGTPRLDFIGLDKDGKFLFAPNWNT